MGTAPVATDRLRQAVQQGGQPPAVRQQDTALAVVEQMKPEILKALPKTMTGDRFMRLLLTTLRQNPNLLTCTKGSLLGAIMQSAQLGIEPGPLGLCYYVPFKQEVTFILGYKGIIDLARDSGELESIEAREVYEGDEFTYAFGLNPELNHKPTAEDRSPANITHVYGIARFKGGGIQFEVLPRVEIDRHRGMSASGQRGPWVDHYAAMARKTVIRVMAPYLPLSPRAQEAIAADEQVSEANHGQDTIRMHSVSTIDVDPVELPGEQERSQEGEGEGDIAPPGGTRRMNREEQLHLQAFAKGDSQIAKDVVRLATEGRITTTGRALSQDEILRVVGIVDLLSDEGSGYKLAYHVDGRPYLTGGDDPMSVEEIDDAIQAIPDEPAPPPAEGDDEHPDPADDLANPFDEHQEGAEQT